MTLPRIVSALVLVLPAAIAAGAQVAAESEQEALTAAVMAGDAAELHPYLLHHSADGRTTVGAVYTRFVRVARYVWMRKQKGLTTEVSDLPELVRQPAMYVVMRAPAGTAGADRVIAAVNRPSSAAPAGSSMYFVPSARRLTPSHSTDSIAALAGILGPIPVPGANLVGTFAADLALKNVLEFCVFEKNADGDYHVVSGYHPGPVR